MYLLLISFFLSLLGIIFMVGRKLVLLKNGNITTTEENETEFLNLKELKQVTFQNIRKYEHMVLVTVLRFYIRSINFLKVAYEKIETKIKNIRRKRQKDSSEKVEVSKFLKVVSEYKQRIREIKHRIHEEENL